MDMDKESFLEVEALECCGTHTSSAQEEEEEDEE